MISLDPKSKTPQLISTSRGRPVLPLRDTGLLDQLLQMLLVRKRMGEN